MRPLILSMLLLFSVSIFAEDKVDINTADKATLETVKGIGEAKAQAILDYRSENGPFASVDDLQKVSGIGSKTLEKLKPFLTVSAPAPVKQPTSDKTSSKLLDLNNATAEELKTLDGIGPTFAKRIVAYRKANGPFKSVDDLLNVEGIRKSTIEKFASAVTVSGSSAPVTSPPKTVEPKTTGRKLKVWHPSL